VAEPIALPPATRRGICPYGTTQHSAIVDPEKAMPDLRNALWLTRSEPDKPDSSISHAGGFAVYLLKTKPRLIQLRLHPSVRRQPIIFPLHAENFV
jgi:hypothetical protein